jgi:drug/metabolite transporter (DMT)-like permease
MRYLLIVTVLWAFSFSLIGEYLAGRVDSDFAALARVLIAALVFLPFTLWRDLPRLAAGAVVILVAMGLLRLGRRRAPALA